MASALHPPSRFKECVPPNTEAGSLFRKGNAGRACPYPRHHRKRNLTRELVRLEQEQEDDKQLALEIVVTARVTAPRLAKMSSISDQRNRWIAYMVQKAVEQREKDVAKWEKKGDDDDDDSNDMSVRPRKVKGAPERALMARRFRKEFVDVFIQTQISNAEVRAKKMLELRASRRSEEAILDNVVGTFLSEFMKDVARETWRAGMLAKNRAEDETGLVFPNPSHMQYGVYSTFRSWWVGRKEQLQRSVERWSIVIANGSLLSRAFPRPLLAVTPVARRLTPVRWRLRAELVPALCGKMCKKDIHHISPPTHKQLVPETFRYCPSGG